MDLHLRNVGLTLPTGRRLFQISDLRFPKGSHVLIRGASGSGKSSLLHLMAGLMTPTNGSILVGPHELSSMSDLERSHLRRKTLGLIFQKLNLLGHLTVSENVEVSLTGVAKAELAKKIATALARVQLGDRANQRASLLSGGEQQRLAVARVLAQTPEIILADEPTSSLDDENAQFVIDALKSAAHGRTLIVVSHDDRLMKSFVDVRAFSDLSQGAGS